ncbi:MAG TPA: cupin domain-containing protein [Gammaproteobacteria bacterium]
MSPGTNLTPHAHRDMHEVFIVLGGRGLLHCKGEIHEIEAGSCIEVAPEEVHAFENPGEDALVMVYFGIAE